MQLIYFSPVPWASFRQRPHEFVDWFHGRFGGDVVWIEPYPVRLPRWADLSRPALHATGGAHHPPWLQRVTPSALPLEPLAAGRGANALLFWPQVLRQIRVFAECGPTAIVVGKPSDLAVRALSQLPSLVCVYDAMDDFPAFHTGLARATCEALERRVVQHATACCTASAVLAQRMTAAGARQVQLVPNGLACARMPALAAARRGEKRSFGYVGTVGAWFDWNWVCQLAADWPGHEIQIHGPLFQPPPQRVPANVVLHPALRHEHALDKMMTFAAGLIPFCRNELTASVDPVKYYEYRACGIPVVSTPFGEMQTRSNVPRVLLTSEPAANHSAIAALLAGQDSVAEIEAFRRANDWATRFEPLAPVFHSHAHGGVVRRSSAPGGSTLH